MSAFLVNADQAKSRLDALVRELGSLSQKKAKLLCAMGAISVNGVCAAATTRVRDGAEVTFQTEYVDLMLSLGLPVSFADGDVLVLQKPPGIATLSVPEGDPSIEDALNRELGGSEIVNHLDRDASGLLLVARTAETLRLLDIAMASGSISREFLTIVNGAVEADQQSIELPEPQLDDTEDDDDDDLPPSTAELTVVARREGFTLLNVAIATGQTHQIRAYLHSAGHPILGDARYGDPAANEHARATFGVHRALLHSNRLRLAHPTSETALDITATAEPDFARIFPTRKR